MSGLRVGHLSHLCWVGLTGNWRKLWDWCVHSHSEPTLSTPSGMELGGTRLCFNAQALEAGVFNIASFDGELLHAQVRGRERAHGAVHQVGGRCLDGAQASAQVWDGGCVEGLMGRGALSHLWKEEEDRQWRSSWFTTKCEPCCICQKV